MSTLLSAETAQYMLFRSYCSPASRGITLILDDSAACDLCPMPTAIEEVLRPVYIAGVCRSRWLMGIYSVRLRWHPQHQKSLLFKKLHQQSFPNFYPSFIYKMSPTTSNLPCTFIILYVIFSQSHFYIYSPTSQMSLPECP